MNMNNLARTHEILTPQLATKVGLTKFEFYKYVKANEYEQVGHGVWSWLDQFGTAVIRQVQKHFFAVGFHPQAVGGNEVVLFGLALPLHFGQHLL